MYPKGAFGRIFAPGSKRDFSPKSGFQAFVEVIPYSLWFHALRVAAPSLAALVT